MHAALASREFRRFQRLVQSEAGIQLSDVKRVLVEARLARRLRELQLDYRSYCALVEADADERVRMLDLISTNETHFFREPRQFAFLERHVFPEWEARARAGSRPRTFRVWSAACSTGEEPYSVAMAFLARFPAESGLEVEILASDISTRVLERARAAVWPIAKAREIERPYLRAFMQRGSGPMEGSMRARPELRSLVRFQRINLNAEPFALRAGFDLVLCRNVLIYFSPESKARVLGRLIECLDSQGYLMLGHAEAVTGMSARLRNVGPTTYVHASRDQA